MRLAVNFPDVRAFYPGMGIEIYENNSEIQKTFKKLSIFAGFNLKKIIYGSNKVFSEKRSQIATLVTTVMIYKEWQNKTGINPDILCGKGIGYCSALICAEKIPLWSSILKLRFGKMPTVKEEYENILDNTEEKNIEIIKQCEVLLELGPNKLCEEAESELIEANLQRKVYLDNPNDSTYIFDHIEKCKLFNYLYAAKNLVAMVVSTPNHSSDAEDYSSLDSAYSELINKIDLATRDLYQNNIEFTEDGFLECADILKKILSFKKIKHEEISYQLVELQNETGFDICKYFREWI